MTTNLIEIKTVCVFGASSPQTKDTYLLECYILGKLLAQAGIDCICGAGRAGVMKALADGVLDVGGKVIGVIPKFMVDNGWAYYKLSEIIVTEDMHIRKETMLLKSDAVIAAPGGCGTFEELLEVITWKQLGLYNKPIVILNIEGYYNDMIAMLSKAVSEHFMKESHQSLWKVVDNAADVMDYLNNCGMSNMQIESKY